MKYIIEFEDAPFSDGRTHLYRAKGFNALVFDRAGLEKLTPYKGLEIRKMGRWVFSSRHPDGFTGEWCHCSVCLKYAGYPTDFCPNCGAQMRNKDER